MGVSATDALDMGALGPLDSLPETVSQSVRAGVDLMLTVHPFELEERALDGLIAEAGDAADGSLDVAALRASRRRIRALRRWLGRAPDQPDLAVVGSADHGALAREIAERAATLVRDRARLVPLRPPPEGPWRIVVIAPRPVDLTPADTSSYTALDLAGALRGALERSGAPASVTAIETPLDPDADAIGALGAAATKGTVTVVGTVDAVAHPGQGRLVEELVTRGVPVVAVALRTPFDILAYPSVGTYGCTYGIQPPNLDAMADALLGRIPFRGRVPVRLQGP
jgi:beta-N-acetylhexosaminidase